MASQILERKKENKRDIERTGRERKKGGGEKKNSYILIIHILSQIF